MDSMNKPTTTTITVKTVNNQVKNELNYNQQQQSNPDNLMVQLASSGIAGVAAASAIMSSKTTAGNQYQFETSPAARKRHQTRLLRKIKDLIDEYAARCGQQICVICCTPLKQQTKFSNNTFKVTGTQPLETVMKNQKQTIVNELDNLLQASYMNNLKEENTSETDSRIDLPSLTIDGIPTSLDKMTQCQLRMFIPLLLKVSTGRGKPGWNKPSCKPVWWPTDLPWASIRVDPRDEESKKKNPWTNVLKTIIKNCYKYHGREDLLHKFSNIESTNQINNETTHNQHHNHSLLSQQSPKTSNKTKQNKQKSSSSLNNGVVETSALVLNELKQTNTNNSTTNNNNPSTTTTQTYAVLQDIRNLEQLTVLPVDISSGLVEVDNLLNNDHYMDHSNSTNELTTLTKLQIIKQSDCNNARTNANTNNVNQVTVITTKQDQQQQQQQSNSRIVSLNDLDGSPILINTDNDNPTTFSNTRGQNVIEINVNQYQNIWGNMDNIHSNTATTTSTPSQTQPQQQQSSTNTTLRKILLTNNTNSTEQDDSDDDEELDDDDDDLINNSNIIELECIASKKAKLSHFENNSNNNDKLNSNNTDSYVENRYKRYKKVN